MNRKFSLKPATALFSALIFAIATVFAAGAFIDTAYAQRGLSLEARAGETSPPPSGRPYMSDLEFKNLLKQADDLLKYGKFNQTLDLLQPYEVYVFGSLEHWNNMARYDWRIAQAYGMKGEVNNMYFYLRCITVTENQPKPTAHLSQYVGLVDNNGVPTGQYFFGAAYNGTDYVIRDAAQAKIDLLLQGYKKIPARTDPRMKYDGYRNSRSRRFN